MIIIVKINIKIVTIMITAILPVQISSLRALHDKNQDERKAESGRIRRKMEITEVGLTTILFLSVEN